MERKTIDKMKKFLILIAVLFSVQSFGQFEKLYAEKINLSGNITQFFTKFAKDGIYDASGNYVMPKVDSMLAIYGFEMPQSIGRFFMCADGVYRNWSDKVLYSDIINLPLTFPPDAHNHTMGEITGLDALAASKADINSPTFTGTVNGITKAMVGLGNVDNTSDANKPVSTAQQTALNLKANLASPAFTGTVTFPTGQALTTTGNIGYTTGAGSTVTQTGNKSNAVTINTRSGQITMNGAALAAAAEVAFTVNNNQVAATDVVIVNIQSVGTAGSYFVTVGAVSAGSFSITLGNVSTASLSQAVVLNFAVIKAVNN